MDTTDLRQVIEQQLALSRKLKSKVAQLQARVDAQHAPLAVVSMAMRLPSGIRTPEDYWRFLVGDEDPVTEIPENRPGLRAVADPSAGGAPGTSYVDRAAFLDGVEEFDAGFFGINSREAEALDPQQRMLLEVSYEALERAGVPVRRQDRLPVGVWVGIMASEYGERLAGREDKSVIDPYYGTGGGHCFAAGRVSYALGLSGPAMSVDTACSSSLVALHLAAASLRRGECRYALVGGTNMIFSADLMVSLSASQALAADGRSKTFRADADGYGRGEGVGVLALMRLADAEAAGHPILAVLRGTAVNHDGASSGLTVPSGPAQQELLRTALAEAGVEAAEVGWVEAHGTGTSLGDPIEMGALDAVLGSGAAGRELPLAVGSVKSRLGHLEAAAGVAGLMKIVLQLQHGMLTPSVAAGAPLNPFIPWARMPVTVPASAQPWPAGYDRRIAGISAFGLSGSNAHALLEAWTRSSTGSGAVPGDLGDGAEQLITLSARDADGLAAVIASVREYVDANPADLAATAHTVRAGRAHQPWRVAFAASSASAVLAALDAASADLPSAAVPAVAPRVTVATGPGAGAVLAALVAAFPLLGAAVADVPAVASSGGPLGSALAGLDSAGVGAVATALFARLGVRARTAPGSSGLAVEFDGNAHGVTSPSGLLSVLTALYLRGADLRLADLAAPGTPLLGDLPTYPFRRRRYWINEPVAALTVATADVAVPVAVPLAVPAVVVPAPAVPVVAPAPVAVGTPSAPLVAVPAQPSDAVPAHLVVSDAPAAPRQEDVEAFLFDELAAVLRAEDDLDPDATFLDVGGDSFTAMLLSKAVEQRFGVVIGSEDIAVDVPLREVFARLGTVVLGGDSIDLTTALASAEAAAVGAEAARRSA